MQIILFDDKHRVGMLPLTYTRPQGKLRCGILTVKEKWQLYTGLNVHCLSNETLANKYPFDYKGDALFIPASVLPNKNLAEQVQLLAKNDVLLDGEVMLAVQCDVSDSSKVISNELAAFKAVAYSGEYRTIRKSYDLITVNKDEIRADFELLNKGVKSREVSETVIVVGANKNPSVVNSIFIEEGADVEYCYLNAQEGPIYIGKNAKIAEGAMLRGPIAVCESAQVSMGAKIYSGTTIGPWSKVGGEVSNSIITGYSNKVHDGYLGDSVLGEWCNLGADTNTSNLKNDFAEVKLWDYSSQRFAKTGLQFCGLIMGDYSRCAINTAFNSGTVVGVGSNIFGSGFPRNFVPSFVIGGPQGYKVNGLKAVARTATMAMARRNVTYSQADSDILQNIFEETMVFRVAFK